MSFPLPALGSGVRILSAPRYEAENSAPHLHRFVFSYSVRIINELDCDITLRSRHWLIVNADGQEREVRGAGVIGIQPKIPSGKEFSYESFSVLDTPFGTMEGAYLFERDDGDLLHVAIPRFYLHAPQAQGG
ncbi:MAG: hypothetical protein RL095_1199 [Verrucomicrobiota bacterium]|jgi:ApaG protein